MTADQFAQLIDFLGRKLDAIEHRLSALEMGQEAMPDDIRALEGRSRSDSPTRRSEGGHDLRLGRDPMMTPHQFDCLMAYLNWWFDRIDRRPDAGESIAQRVATIEARIQSNVDAARRRLEVSRHRG